MGWTTRKKKLKTTRRSILNPYAKLPTQNMENLKRNQIGN